MDNVIALAAEHVTPQRWLALQASLIAVLMLGAAYNLGRMKR